MKKLFKDRLLIFLAGVMLLLFLIQPKALVDLPDFIHWPTLVALVVLLIVTTGIQQSGLMEQYANRLIHSVATKRVLCVTLVLFSVVSAMILTNDIALFLIIPFTLQLESKASLPVRRLLIFETIAVNAGSMLTPIGNPQNIYLWEKSQLSFLQFVMAMLPVFLIQLILLLAFVFLFSENEPLKQIPDNRHGVNYKLASISFVLLIGYLIADHIGIAMYAAGFIVLLFLIFYRAVFQSIDWSLVIIFLLLFIDMGIISGFPFLKTFNHSLDLSSPLNLATVSAGYSQVISNVPATLLLSHYTNQWIPLAWGVNIGANGLLTASFANLIAIRLAYPHKISWYYHWYSIPFLLISVILTYFLLF